MGEVIVTFRHLEASPELRRYAVEKVSKVKKYFDDPHEINVVLSLEKHRCTAEITLKANRTVINAKEETDDMYSAIDLAVDKVYRQMKKYKEKIRHYKTPAVPRKEQERVDAVSPKDAREGRDQPFPFVKTETVIAKPMSVEEAVMQLKVHGNDFLVFINTATGKVSVIYHRKDGAYGLIEPEV